MTRPRLLDLFCGAGGAAKGYQMAGFEVIGVDIVDQPRYCGDFFVQIDALKFPIEFPFPHGRIDAIHASPPCPHYANVTRWRGNPDNHPALIDPTRRRLANAGVPWVIENVRTRELRNPFVLCGSMFDLPIRRHRYFETNWAPYQLVQPCRHRPTDLPFMHKGERAYADAMGCGWMTNREARQAIPPAYTEWIGRLLLEALERAA